MSIVLSCGAQDTTSLVIHFDENRYELRSSDKRSIDSILLLLQPGPGKMKTDADRRLKGVMLSGHCDSIGGYGYNDSLSHRRAFAVRDYLHSKGISADRFLGIDGFGKRRPLNDNGDKEKRSLNRRVEIRLFFDQAPASASTDAPLPSPSHLATQEPGSPPPSEPGGRSPKSPKITLSQFFKDTVKGKTYVLQSLHFFPGLHVLVPNSDSILQELLRIMLDSPNLKIEIMGHVCCIPEELDGLDKQTNTNDLSVRRAKFVYDYLRKGGVKASRMSYHGFGASRKLYPQEINEEEQAANRRVEIRKNPQD